ncbi:ACT domain-containing protein [Candidatus Woesearchaeota archaeon]|nr:ACT domain-containing protein [Candidatus Woesearchaeota archaeon]
MSITKAVESYVSERPSIRDCLKRKLINYSALSRMIGAELGIKSFDAILIACRRYAVKLKGEVVLEKRIIGIVKGSKVEVRNKVAVAVIEKSIYHDDLLKLEKEIKKKRENMHLIEGANAITIVTSQDFLPLIRQLFRGEIISISKDLAEINIKSPLEIESTPGVLSYLCSLFSDHSINIVENMSCWGDTMFVIREADMLKAIDALRF